MRLLPFVLKSLLRKKLRTALTLLSILFPLLVIIAMGTFLRALDFADPGTTAGHFRVVTRHKVGLATQIPLASLRRIETLPGVKAITVLDRFGGLYRDESARNVFPRFATDPETFLSVFDDATIVAGSAEAWRRDPAAALVGEKISRKYGWKVGDRVVVKGNLYPIDLDVVVQAIYSLPYENSGSLFFHRRYLEEAWPPFRGQVSTIWTRVESARVSDELPREIDAFFENSPYPTKSESESAFLTGFVELLGNVRLLLGSLAVVVVVVIVLVAANTMAMATRERVVEIAVMRALGYSRVAVTSLIVAEGVLMALAAALLGIGLFLVALKPIRTALSDTRLAAFAAGMRVFPGLLLLGLGVALFIGVAASLIPAVLAGRRPIVEGLRGT